MVVKDPKSDFNHMIADMLQVLSILRHVVSFTKGARFPVSFQ